MNEPFPNSGGKLQGESVRFPRLWGAFGGGVLERNRYVMNINYMQW